MRPERLPLFGATSTPPLPFLMVRFFSLDYPRCRFGSTTCPLNACFFLTFRFVIFSPSFSPCAFSFDRSRPFRDPVAVAPPHFWIRIRSLNKKPPPIPFSLHQLSDGCFDPVHFRFLPECLLLVNEAISRGNVDLSVYWPSF